MAFTTECVSHDTKPSCEEFVNELADAFEFFDLNGDGSLSMEELGTVVRSLGDAVTDQDLHKLMKRADGDGDGQLDLREFVDLNTQAISTISSSSLASEPSDCETDAVGAAFTRFDVDNDGFISAEEVHRVLAASGDAGFSLEECLCMIKSVDADGDRVMSLRELQDLMNDNRDFHAGGSDQSAVAATFK